MQHQSLFLLLSTFLAVAFVPATTAVSDCTTFGKSCEQACSNGVRRPYNATCSEFLGSCDCLGSTTNDKSKSDAFCSTLKDTCSKTVCVGSPMDSFSCDGPSLQSQCLCKSNSNLNGGALMGSNETSCAKLIKTCAQKTCAASGVLNNSCTDPKTAVCQCIGGNTSTTNSTTEPQKQNSASAVNLSTVAVGALIALAFAVVV